MKQSVADDNSVQRLQEVEMPALENGVVETLTEGSNRRDFDWAWLLWLNRRLLARWTMCGLVIATLVAFLTPKEFDSTTRIMPPDPRSGSGAAMMASMAGQGAGSLAGSALGGIAGDLLGMHDGGAVFNDMLHSRTVQDRIIARLDLRKVYGSRYWEDARKQLANHTTVLLDRKSGVITITVTDRDPNRAAQLTQSYVEELDRIAAEVNTSAARRERIFIEQRLKTMKQDLDAASQKFSEYASKNATPDIKEQGVAMVQAAAVLRGQLIAAQSDLEGLEQIYTNSNVRVRALRARVDELQRQLNKVGGDALNPGSGDRKSDQELPSIRQLPLLGVRWADLYREAEIQATMYKLLTEQYELAKIEEAKETPVVKVLDAAVVPERKSSPPRLLIMLLGTLLAFSLGVVWLLGTAAWHQMDPDNPSKQLGEEVSARVVVVCSFWADKIPGIAKTRAWRKRRNAYPDSN